MYIVTWIGFFAIIASMAEMSSMAPTSGGQYHVRNSTIFPLVSHIFCKPNPQEGFLELSVSYLESLASILKHLGGPFTDITNSGTSPLFYSETITDQKKGLGVRAQELSEVLKLHDRYSILS